jgi:hypothetical protein
MSPALRHAPGARAAGATAVTMDDDLGIDMDHHDEPELRDRYRQCFMNMPCKLFHVFILVTTLALFCASFIEAKAIRAPWYLAVECVIMLLFAGELLSRIYISRSNFWHSRSNLAEAVICFLCVASFAVMLSRSDATKEEHEVFLGLRYVAQALRVSVYFRSTWRTMTSGAVSGGGPLGDSTLHVHAVAPGPGRPHHRRGGSTEFASFGHASERAGMRTSPPAQHGAGATAVNMPAYD